MTFLTTFLWELAQWIAIVGLVLIVAFLWVAVRFLRVGMSALVKSSPILNALSKMEDKDDA